MLSRELPMLSNASSAANLCKACRASYKCIEIDVIYKQNFQYCDTLHRNADVCLIDARFLQEQLAQDNPEALSQCYFFNSFFYKKLAEAATGQHPELSAKELAHFNVHRWTKVRTKSRQDMTLKLAMEC